MLQSVRVLVVDPNPGCRALAEAIFKAFGCEVSLAADGTSAEAAARERAFDLILMDRLTPRRGGDVVARAIRSGGASRRSMIVACGAEPPPAVVRGLYDGAVTKPIYAMEAAMLVQDAAGRAPQGPSGRPEGGPRSRKEDLRRYLAGMRSAAEWPVFRKAA